MKDFISRSTEEEASYSAFSSKETVTLSSQSTPGKASQLAEAVADGVAGTDAVRILETHIGR